MKSHAKLDVWVRPMPRYRNKLWLHVRTRNGDPEWVPSFEDWFRMIRALCYCEIAKYQGRVLDPLELPRRFFVRCFDADLRDLDHDEAWAKLRQEFRFLR